LCSECISFLGQAIANAGYTRAELEALPLDACAMEHLSTLLAKGATIDTFLKVSACPRDASMYENVTFPGEEGEGDIGKAVQSAFAPVVESYRDNDKDAVDATKEEKKKAGFNVVGFSISLAVIVVCFAGVTLFAVHRKKMKQKLNALYVQRNHDTERNVPVTARRVREILSFRNITCQLKTNGGGGRRPNIIKGISGKVCEGSVCAIMGPSGSGKTTLVKAIISASGFHIDIDKKITTSGNAHFSGNNRIGYVPQHSDYLLKYLTTSESILYAASLRLPWYVSKQTKVNKVNALLDELSLAEVQNTRVTDLSGGERKRLSIAMEMVVESDLLILDEPTSGLDSKTGDMILKVLKSIATRGRGILCTVHSPSARSLCEQIDTVLLLSSTGNRLYFGSVSLNLFEAVQMPCPKTFSLPEWLLEVASAEKMSEHFLRKTTEFKESETTETDVIAGNQASHDFYDKSERSFVTELSVLCWREILEVKRNISRFVTDTVTAILVGVLIGLLYLDVEKNLRGFQNRMGSIFFVLFFFALSSVSCCDAFLASRNVFLREKRAGYYRADTYYLSKLFVEIVVLRWTSVVLTSISYYWLMGLRIDPGAFFVFLGFAMLFSATSTALMSFIQTLCASTAIATLVGIVCVLLSSLFGGFLINIPTLPGFCSWIRWFSPFFYAWGGMLGSEMNDGKYLFDADFDGTNVAVVVSGSTYLNVVGVDPANIGRDAIALIIVLGVYMASAIFMYRQFQ
jgi:ABC-type multidrug transport system ATPase subunit